jgi:hypothetical protein
MGEPLLHGGGVRAGMWWGMRQDPHSLGGRAFLRDTRSAADSERPPRCSMSTDYVIGFFGFGEMHGIRHWEVTARVQKAFLSFFSICLTFFNFLLTWREHAWVSWSVRRGAYRGRASSCEYVRCAPSHRGPVRP